MMNYENKICVVTGSTSGIGLGIAEYLLEHGATVYVSGRTLAHMDNAREKLAKFGDRVRYEMVDLCDYKRAEAYVKRIGDENERIDYVFANAGGGTVTRFDEITWDMWEDIIGSNFLGAVAALKAAVPFMKKQMGGHLIVTSSVAGFSANPYQASYVATKHALYGMIQSLHYELEPYNITCQAICPSFVRTPIFTRDGEPEEAIPPQCISIEEAVDEIFAGIENGDITIKVCKESRAYYDAIRNNPDFCDSAMRDLAAFYQQILP